MVFSTPKINKVEEKELNFYDAIREVMQGKYITRKEWNNSDFCLLKDGLLTIWTKGEFHNWLINDGDINGTDWIVTLSTN